MSIDTYLALRNRAGSLPDLGGYRSHAAEMNPAIFERFVDEVKNAGLLGVIWEPFAGTSYPESLANSYTQDSVKRTGIRVISYGLAPRNSRIQVKDSTIEGPGEKIGGVLFHPPYPGSMPLSDHPCELSKKENWSWEWYTESLRKTIRLAKDSMIPGGLVCAVGSDYSVYSERIRLGHLYLNLFEKEGFVLWKVWLSLPDVVQIYKT
jgi:hypothetical protein